MKQRTKENTFGEDELSLNGTTKNDFPKQFRAMI
jgi:hypothetical protein